MRSRYSIVIVVAVIGFVASSAQAIELSLTPNWEQEGDMLYMTLSGTAVISIYMEIGDDDGNVSFANIFFDATPFGDPSTKGYDVVGNEFKMTRNNGEGWFRNEGDSSSRNIEDYSLIAADDEGGGGPGTDGPWEGVVDSIIIHGTEIGSYDLYFENSQTAEGAPRVPGIFDRNNVQHPYSNNLHLPGFIWFRNAWPMQDFEFPFEITVVPEPSTVGLFLVGAGAAAFRPKRNLS